MQRMMFEIMLLFCLKKYLLSVKLKKKVYLTFQLLFLNYYKCFCMPTEKDMNF